jgi:hypothetical protein
MITRAVLQRVFHINYDGGSGTCFTLDYEGKQYVVTARHVVDGIKNSDEVSIWKERDWWEVPIQVVGIAADKVDIAVLAAPIQLSPQYRLTASHHRLTLGQDVFFLGFPVGIKSELGDLNNGFPLPLVKKAVLSAMTFDIPETYLLDGHLNYGFSGGPVVFDPPGRMPPKHLGDIVKIPYRVTAVVSSFNTEVQTVIHNGKKTQYRYESNSGIIICFDIFHAINLIKANPIGFVLPPKSLDEMDEEDVQQGEPLV